MPTLIYLYNNEYETMPSLLGDNVYDLLDQAYELGMTHMYCKFADSDLESWYELQYDRRLGVIPILIRERFAES